jgi:hypothetical protein
MQWTGGCGVVVSSLPTLEQECFFIAPIGKDGSEERHRSDGVLEFIVARAASELDLQAVRADQLAEPGQITLQVIEHVLGARAAVADLTGRNPNVYYELAIRHTAKLPTVLICEQGEVLPFDIAQMRTIFFSHTDLRSADRCRSEIVRQLRQALEGAVDSPVAASVDLQRLQAGNTVERNVAELVTSVSDLRKAVHAIREEVNRAVRHGRPDSGVWAMETARQMGYGLDHLIHEARKQRIPEAERLLTELRATLPRDLDRSLPATLITLWAANLASTSEVLTPTERTKLAEWLAATDLMKRLSPQRDDDQG